MQQPVAGNLYKEKFIASARGQWMPVNTCDIACFVRDQLNYLYTFSGEKYMLDYNTLEEIEDLLNPQVFEAAAHNHLCSIAVQPGDVPGIQLADHLIFGEKSYFSFSDNGLLSV